MEGALRRFLKNRGVGNNTLRILEDEEILSMGTFFSLGDKHFSQLLPKLTVGQHALLLHIRHDERDIQPSSSRSSSTSGILMSTIVIIFW